MGGVRNAFTGTQEMPANLLAFGFWYPNTLVFLKIAITPGLNAGAAVRIDISLGPPSLAIQPGLFFRDNDGRFRRQIVQVTPQSVIKDGQLIRRQLALSLLFLSQFF